MQCVTVSTTVAGWDFSQQQLALARQQAADAWQQVAAAQQRVDIAQHITAIAQEHTAEALQRVEALQAAAAEADLVRQPRFDAGAQMTG